MDDVLVVSNLRKQYDAVGGAVHALNGVSLAVRAGEFVALMGASGSGKSTLLHLIAGLDAPSGGSITIGGHDIAGMNDRRRTLFRRRSIGVVFQAYNLLPTLTAAENVALPAIVDGRNHGDAERRASSLIDLVGLKGRANHRPQAMSGGEQQRVAVARSLMNDPLLILADEPTGNLDTQHSEKVWRLLAGLVREQGRTVVAVTHEPTGATFADRVLILEDGRIVGELCPGGEGHAALVAARYTELVG